MTEQTALPTNGSQPKALSGLADSVAAKLDSAVDRLRDALVERKVFETRTHGSRTIITASSVSTWGGYGFGFGLGEGKSDGEGGGGGGIGGGGEGRPIAVIEVDDEGVRIRPVFDVTKLGLTVIAAILTVWKALR